MHETAAIRGRAHAPGRCRELPARTWLGSFRSARWARIASPARIAGIGLATALTTSAACHAEPFSFRGIALGTSLSDLRRIQFPEAPGARILCSHDLETIDIRPTAEYVAPEGEARAGVVVCGAYTFGKVLGAASKVLPSEWLLARLDAGAIEAAPLFWFVPEGKADPEETGRLYRIAIRSNTAYWPEARAAYVRRYGPPTSIEVITFRQEGKRDLPAEILTWATTQSTIRLAQRDEVATRMAIAFEHTELKPREP